MIPVRAENGKEIENDENSESDDEDDSSPMSSPKIADGKYAGYIIENGRIRGNNKKLTKIDIPDGVTGIEDNAFEGYKSLIEVTIPDSVTYIGDSAFNGCSKLTKIVIPEAQALRRHLSCCVGLYNCVES